MSLGPAEILAILVVALLVFGPHKLPEVGRQVGRTMREFRRWQQVMRRDLDEVFGHDDVNDASHAAQPAPTLPPKTEGAAPDADAREKPGAPEPSPRPERDDGDGDGDGDG